MCKCRLNIDAYKGIECSFSMVKMSFFVTNPNPLQWYIMIISMLQGVKHIWFFSYIILNLDS
jgi:hypothetical protein